jgi:hypothetical protein
LAFPAHGGGALRQLAQRREIGRFYALKAGWQPFKLAAYSLKKSIFPASIL